MDGDVQSDSSSEIGSGSESSGQGTYDEVLKELESINQKVDKLSEESVENKNSLTQLKDEINSLTAAGGIGNVRMGEVKETILNGNTGLNIPVEEGAKAIVFGGAQVLGGGNTSPYTFGVKVYKGSEICWTSTNGYFANYYVLLPEGSTTVNVWTDPGKNEKFNYCFLMDD